MYKLTRRSNLIPFMLVLAAGIAASIFVPQVFPQTMGDIPAFALFPGEIAVALILSVLLFENASPAELIKIAGLMLIIAFLDGAFCNMIGGNTTWIQDATFRLNWVQLIAFNVTGMGAIISYYTTEGEPSPYNAVRDQAPAKEVSKIDFTPAEGSDKPQAVNSGVEAQDILGSLDVGRINQLEQSISTTPEKVSLESLFAEETHAASSSAAKKVEPQPVAAPPVAPVEEPVAKVEPVIEAPKAAEPEPTPAPKSAAQESDAAAGRLFGDVSNDIENIFNDLVSADESQKDFTPAAKDAAPSEDKPPVAPPPGPADAPVAEVVDATPPADATPQNFGPQLTDAGTSAKTAVKEFGKLSAAAHKPDSSTGTLKTIGQMLLDSAAVERIIKSADKNEGGSKWRVLTVDRGANLQALMDKLATFEGVESALLMGKDGLLLSNTESLSAMKYVYGPLSLAMQSTTGLGTAELQMGELRQCVLRSGDKVSILTDVGSAILCVFADWNVSTLDALMEFIGKSITGSDALGDELPEEVPDLAEAPVAEAPKPEPVVEAPKAAEPSGGMMNVSDNEMSDLFDNLLDESSSDKKKDAPAPAAPAKKEEPAGGIMKVSDDEMSDLFDNLLDEKSGDKKKDEPAPAPVAEKKAEPTGGIMNVSDNEMSDLFDNLLADGGGDKKEAPKAEEKKEEAPAAPVAEKPPETKKDKKGKPAEKIKEFGKLSATAAKQEVPTGEGGAMKAIGRQLIDVQAVENIIKAGEKREKIGSGLTTARVISAARGEGIKTLLSQIDTFPGVIGSLIVGHDGLVIASTLQSGIDKDMMGALCTAIHSHTDVAAKKCDQGKLNQIVFLSEDMKLTVMTGVAVGILAVFVDNCDLPAVDGLLGAIETTVRG